MVLFLPWCARAIVLSIDSLSWRQPLEIRDYVEGTVSQEHGLETGVVVNGRIAVVSGNRLSQTVCPGGSQNQIRQ